MMCPRVWLCVWIGLVVGLNGPFAAGEITVERTDKGAAVKIDGQAFTEYLTDVNGTPALWPIIGPTGKPMTRAYPMAEGPKTERKDHPHHRSLWFNHGEVSIGEHKDLSFWHRETIRHREFVKLQGGDEGVIVTRDDWVAPDGTVLCTDERHFTFAVDGQTRRIDFDITLKAGDKPVTFGDTKEGTMGIRVASTMKVDAGLGGTIVNSRGQKDKEAWGKPAEWVDYYGPVDGETVGIAVLNHPSSFRFPTYWHVRTYGLFAANPFGLHDFTGAKDDPGEYTIEPGASITLRYRILLHKGDAKAAGIGKEFAEYAKEKE